MVCNNCALYMLLYKPCRGFYRCSKRVVNARSVFQEHHLVSKYNLLLKRDKNTMVIHTQTEMNADNGSWLLISYYSGTSVSGPSQQRPTSLQRPKRRVRIDFSIDLTHFEPPNNGNGILQTPASGQRPDSRTLYFRRKLPPRTAKFKTTPLLVKPHTLFVRRIHCNIHPYKGHLSTRAKRSDPKVALLRRFHCIEPPIRIVIAFLYV